MLSLLGDDGSMMYRYLKKEKVRSLINEHKAGVKDNHKILFSLVVFEEWLRVNAY